jgi:nucleotide-binding universal stress UspA family protein
MTKMLIPLDASQASEVALPVASAIAKAFGHEIVLFSVWDIGLDAPIQDPERVRDLADRGKEYLMTYLRGAAREVELEGIRCDPRVTAGHPAAEILTAITGSDIDLVAMATHGRRATSEGRRGSVADKVLRNSVTPVLAVGPVSRTAQPEHRPASIRRILVPLDGTEDSERGLSFALELGPPLSASIEVLRVVPRLLEEYGHALPKGYLAPIDKERREEANRYLAVRGRHPAIAAAHVEMGAPRREILALLQKSTFDLVVMMSRSIRGQGKWALGGVADRVIEGPTPVILVPPPTV